MNRAACLAALILGTALRATAADSAGAWLSPPPPGAAYPAGEADREFAVLSHDLKNRALFARVAPQTFHPEALVVEADRDPLDLVLRRSRALLADLRRRAPARDFGADAAAMEELTARAAATVIDDAPARRALFDEALRLRRRIAFANPLLDFSSILFIKRKLALMDHMCDQYYGVAQQPGGGLFILEDPFGPAPRLRDVLESAKVENGRLAGRALSGGPRRAWNLRYDEGGVTVSGEPTEGGSFLSPALSYDGRTIAFAYVECEGDGRQDNHLDPKRGRWAPGRAYHLFTVGIDGTNLRQLTDGAWNDFSPCFMPGGRLAFISERRGGYLRCGRNCPTYTLFDLAPDGSDIRCLSWHETNEWAPSVTHDGLIIWTRWDYVDRHGCVAHHPWITTPDGCDPRAIHGNYSLRPRRPDMETDVRAIPGSHRFIATGAPHHGQSFGSLVVVDPRVQDDDAMGPVKRFTPGVAFPETERGPIAYGTAWPLDETYLLCVYEPEGVPAAGPRRAHGLYLVDAFGNRELIYRDPDIACMSPMPVRPRPVPPVVPERSERVAEGAPAEAVVVVADAYRSLKPWPEGTKIKALRVYQIFPSPVGTARQPHQTGFQVPQGNDSVNLARAVLGTVPVEADGSAHFIAPARKELFFQALDVNGLAVTSMRSATHFQPGERITCQGCHEPKLGAPAPAVSPRLAALQRPPSRIAPDVDGTNPFSYPRLVQPVLERHCLDCHAKHPDRAPRLDAEIVVERVPGAGPSRFYASYVSLAKTYGFYDYGGRGWEDPKWYRTTPGEFGARASKLYALLLKGHHDVVLPPEDLHRLTVWLDSCSLFYGVYEAEGGEAQRRREIARPTLE